METTPFNARRLPTVGSTTQVDTTGILRPIPTVPVAKPFVTNGKIYGQTGGFSQLNKSGEITGSFDASGNAVDINKGSGTSFGANVQTAQLGLNVAQGIGNFLAVREQNQIARDTFEFNKKNLNRDYEQRLADYNRRVDNSDRLTAGNLGFGNKNDFITERDNGSTFVNDSRPKPQSGNSRKLKKLPSRKDK